MKHLIIPVLSSFLPLDLKIDSGRLSATGNLEARGLWLGWPERGLRFDVETLRGKLDLVSLALGGKFIIPGAQAQGVRVVWDMRVSGQDGDGPAEKSPEKDAAEPEDDDPGFLPVPFPVSVGKARLEGVELLVLRDGKRQVRVGPAHLTLAGLSAGSTAEIRLFGPGILTTDGVEEYSGNTRHVLELTQDPDGAVTGARAQGETSLAVAAVGLGENLVFRSRLEGRLSEGALESLDVDITGARGEVRLGSIQGAARRGPEDRSSSPAASRPLLEVNLSLKALTADFLNPFLLVAGNVQVAGGKIDANVKLEQKGKTWHFRGGVQGKGLAVRIRGEATSTPVIDLNLEQRGSWDAASSRLTVDQSGTKVQQGGRALLAVTLDKPLSLDFDPGEQAREQDPAVPTGPDVRMNAKIFPTHIKALESWLDLLGYNPLGDLAEGTVQGDLNITVAGDRERIRCKGTLDLNGLVGKPGRGFPGPGPLSVKARLEGSAARGFREIAIEPSTVKLYRATDLLVSAGVRGRVNPSESRTDLKVDLHSDSLPRALLSLGILSRNPKVTLGGGRLEGQCEVSVNGPGPGVRMKGEFGLTDLRVDLTDGPSMKRSLNLMGDLGIQDAGAGITVSNLLILETADPGTARSGYSRGELSISGVLRLKKRPGEKAGKKAGKLDVHGNNLEAAPWLAFLGKPVPAAMGALPVDIRLIVQQDPGFERITVEGSEEVTVASGPGKTPGKQALVRLSNRIELDGKGGAIFQAEINASRGKGAAPDQLTLNGEYRKALQKMDGRPNLRAALHVRNLDAGIYLEPLLEQETQVPAQEAPPPAGADPEETGFDTPFLNKLISFVEDLPLDLDLQAAVDRFRLRKLSVDGLKMTLEAAQGDLLMNLPSASIAGGKYHAKFEHRTGALSQSLLWDVGGSRIDLGVLLAATRPGDAWTTSGTLSFESQGQGRVPPGGVLEKSVTGMLDATLIDGRFGESALLDFMAKTTGVDVFRHMVFTMCQAEVEIRDGFADLENVYVTGTAARFVARGNVSLNGDLDVSITPYLMPGMSGMVKEVKLASALLKTVEGFLLIPVDIRIKGPYQHPRYSARPVAGHLLKQGGSAVKGVVGGVVNGGISFMGDMFKEGPVKAVGSRVEKGGEIVVDTVTGTGQLVGNAVEESVDMTGEVLGLEAEKTEEPAGEEIPE
jgi:hypothetical protein